MITSTVAPLWPPLTASSSLDSLCFLPSARDVPAANNTDRKSTRLNSSHGYISYAVFCLKKKKRKCRHNENRLHMTTAIPCRLLRHSTCLLAVAACIISLATLGTTNHTTDIAHFAPTCL